jgi:hypothetical protein
MRLQIAIGTMLSTVAIATASLSGQSPARWLDQPLTSWNAQAAVIPQAGLADVVRAALDQRCGSARLEPDTTTDAIRAAGWVPFLHLDQAIARGEVAVIGGMTAASRGCEPESFNLFVFVGGKFAGTASPVAITPARDGAAGAVRITGADSLTVEFARYQAGDSECCPSSRVRVTYRIDKLASGPTLIPIDMRQLR